MAANPVVLFLLLILLVVGVLSLVLALRNRLAFRIAMRNVRRGGSRTVLLLLGLLVGTTIISGSLIVGDTVNQINLHYTYLAIGYSDELVYNQSPSGSQTMFPYAVYTQLAAGLAGDSQVAGTVPMIVGTTQGFDRTSGVPQTNLHLVGVNGSQSSVLGSFETDGGQSLAGAAPGQVLLDDQAASELSASAGDHLTLYGSGAAPYTTVVQAVVQENYRGAFLTGGLGTSGNVFVDLATAQTLSNATGKINLVSITNTGSQPDGVALSDSVSAKLNSTLATVPGSGGLKVYETLKDALATAATAGSSISTLFLVLGLFSIVAGAMLIVGIFVMLAEERKGEMGMLRAVGLTRGQLVYTYYFEGLAYSAGSALAGTVVGVGVGYGLTYAFALLLGGSGTGLTQSAILSSFTVSQLSLVLAYVLGFLLTIVTVAVASRRASRLNIVRAIRDIPEPPPARKLYTYLAYIGVAALIPGGLLFFSSYRGTSDLSEPLIGGAMMILGIALIGSRFLKNRIIFTAAGLAFLAWAGLEPLHTAVLGTEHTGGIFIVFVEGITMVLGALLVYVFNSSVLVQGLIRLAGGSPQRAPVARVALSYPGRQPTRTTINLAIFSLVIFTLVAIATFGATETANLHNIVATESGGYTFVAYSATAIPNFPAQVAGNVTLAPLFSTVVPMVTGGVLVNVSGFSQNPFGDSVYAGPAGVPASSSFYSTNQFTFQSTWHGMSAASVMALLQSNTSVTVVDRAYGPPTTNVGGGPPPGPPHPIVAAGDQIRLTDPDTGNSTTVRVIGIFVESFISGVWINPVTAAGLGFHSENFYFLTTTPGTSATHAANLAKAAFFPWGLTMLDFGDLIAQSISTTEGFISLLQVFVGLGLAVGIAGMGIVALRAVVERRREIGMLRASGFTERMVLKAFLLEYSFVSLLGIGIGTALGLLIVYDLSISPSAAAAGVSTFSVPWLNLLLILVIAYVLAMAAVAGPSLRAARLPPAEAVRATE